MTSFTKLKNLYKMATLSFFIIILLFSNCAKFAQFKTAVDDLKIENIDLRKIPDGIYFGSCDLEFVSVKTKVVVKNHTIQRIELIEHNNGKGKKAEVIIDNVISAQSLDVDVITGATASSKVILKAIENSLLELNKTKSEI